MDAPTGQSGNKKIKRTRSKLGRGLNALIDQSPIQSPIQVSPTEPTEQIANKQSQYSSAQPKESDSSLDRAVQADQVLELMVQEIVPNPHQPRRVFTDEAIEELSQSIMEHGLLQPIAVRRASARSGAGKYEIIAGERRWRASKHAGIEVIRAIVLDVDDLVSAELALIENIQREDLNPIERAMGFAMLAERFSMTQDQISKRVGINRSSVANMLRLLELDDEVQSMIASEVLSAGHGKALLSCRAVEQRKALADQAIKDGWSVRFLEKAVQQINRESSDQSGSTPNSSDVENTTESRLSLVIKSLEKQLSDQLSTQVRLKTDKSGTKGNITIEFYNLDHFDGLMGRLGVQASEDVHNR